LGKNIPPDCQIEHYYTMQSCHCSWFY